MHEKYVETTKKNADIIIKNEYDPKVEAANSGLHETQIKFKLDKAIALNVKKYGAELEFAVNCLTYRKRWRWGSAAWIS